MELGTTTSSYRIHLNTFKNGENFVSSTSIHKIFSDLQFLSLNVGKLHLSLTIQHNLKAAQIGRNKLNEYYSHKNEINKKDKIIHLSEQIDSSPIYEISNQ